MTALRQCSRVLERSKTFPIPSDAQFSEIRQRATELINAINDADDLPASVRAALLGYAYDALRDLDLYYVQGASPLINDVDRLRGEVSRDPGLVSAVVKDKKLWAAVVHFSEALLVIAALVHTPLAISADVQKYQAQLAAVPTYVVAPADTSPVDQASQ